MEEKEQIKQGLKELFKEDINQGKHPIIYTTLKHVSRSGMLRHIDVIYPKDGDMIVLNWHIENLGLYKRAKTYKANNAGSLRVSGCGMDMGFSVVYDLSSALYGHGKECSFICLGENCRSNDHVNGDKDRKPHNHSDGGYLLNQRWI